MALNSHQEQMLKAPFHAWEHSFDNSGNVYLEKTAIRHRLSLVDPAWSQSKPELVAETLDLVSLSASITVCGSTRSALGVGIIQRWKKGGGEMQGYELARATRQAYKTADADLVPRIGMQFDIGAYLKTPAAKNCKTEEQLKKYLETLPPPPDSHWSLNGGRQRIADLLKSFGLEWEDIKSVVEPGRTLGGLSETSLTETEFVRRLAEIAFKPAAPKAAAPPPAEAATVSHHSGSI